MVRLKTLVWVLMVLGNWVASIIMGLWACKTSKALQADVDSTLVFITTALTAFLFNRWGLRLAVAVVPPGEASQCAEVDAALEPVERCELPREERLELARRAVDAAKRSRQEALVLVSALVSCTGALKAIQYVQWEVRRRWGAPPEELQGPKELIKELLLGLKRRRNRRS
jgi:hypothetical protein